MQKNKKFSSGFTLIELLVVIAIIGILTSVVLASLNTARSKGGDAGVKDNLSSIRTEAEIYYDGAGNKTYGTGVTNCDGGMFTADTSIKGAIAAAKSAGGGTVNCTAVATAPQTWAVAAMLKTASNYWCVDSSGAATTSASGAVTSGVCQP